MIRSVNRNLKQYANDNRKILDNGGKFDQTKLRAKEGSVQDMYSLASIYRFDAEKKNLKNAFYWYTEAANRFHVNSMVALAEMHKNGEGVEIKSYYNARQWLNRAADCGDIYAAQLLTILDKYGAGMSPEPRVRMHTPYNNPGLSTHPKLGKYTIEHG